jgi:hypothetical protein
MITPDISHLEPWIEHLRIDHHQSWFREVFRRILGFGYDPRDFDDNDIQNGHALLWQKGDTYITAKMCIEFDQSGDASGLVLTDEGESYEIQLSVNTPLEVVHAAIKHLNPDEE